MKNPGVGEHAELPRSVSSWCLTEADDPRRAGSRAHEHHRNGCDVTRGVRS